MLEAQKISFDIAPELLSHGLRGVYLVIHGLVNKDNDPGFEEYKQHEIKRLLDEYANFVPDKDATLKGFRDLHTSFGFSNRNFPAAPETLLENLLKYRRLAHINLLVDIYNLVSLQTRLALGAHDLAHVVGNIHLRPMTGTERYLPLGSSETKTVRNGGYAYIDDANDIICMLDSRQVEKTKVTTTTTDVFYIIQGNNETDQDYILQGARKLVSLTRKYCGGQIDILYPDLPDFSM